MEKDVYKIIGRFICECKPMIIVKIKCSVSVMTEYEYNSIITAERKYYQRKNVA